MFFRSDFLIKVATWGMRSEFSYEGSVNEGTTIYFGKSNKIYISKQEYKNLLRHYKYKKVNVGTSRTHPPVGSVGEWLSHNIARVALASYVGPILIREGYAQKDKSFIQFI
jgi:hypothetical protein